MKIIACNEQNNKTRFGGLDVYRCILMSLVCFIHFKAYSDVSNADELLSVNRIVLDFLGCIFPSVFNGFVLLSGFLNIKKTINKSVDKAINLWMKVYTASIILFFIGITFSLRELEFARVLRSLFPVLTGSYWYIGMTLLLYILSPLLAQLLSQLDYNGKKALCVTGGVIFTIYFASNPFIAEISYLGEGCSLIWYVYVYCMGSCIREGIINLRKCYAILLFTISFALSFIITFRDISVPWHISVFSEYSIIPFLMSLSLFFIFKNWDYKGSVLLSRLSTSALFVYIIQEHDMIRSWYWELFNIKESADSILLIPKYIISTIILWISAIIMQFIVNAIMIKNQPLIERWGSNCLKFIKNE